MSETARRFAARRIRALVRAVCEAQGIALEHINRGWCDMFADRLLRILPGARLRECSEKGHLWVEWNGLHFDSAHPCGVKDWRRLGAAVPDHLPEAMWNCDHP